MVDGAPAPAGRPPVRAPRRTRGADQCREWRRRGRCSRPGGRRCAAAGPGRGCAVGDGLTAEPAVAPGRHRVGDRVPPLDGTAATAGGCGGHAPPHPIRRSSAAGGGEGTRRRPAGRPRSTSSCARRTVTGVSARPGAARPSVPVSARARTPAAAASTAGDRRARRRRMPSPVSTSRRRAAQTVDGLRGGNRTCCPSGCRRRTRSDRSRPRARRSAHRAIGSPPVGATLAPAIWPAGSVAAGLVRVAQVGERTAAVGEHDVDGRGRSGVPDDRVVPDRRARWTCRSRTA